MSSPDIPTNQNSRDAADGASVQVAASSIHKLPPFWKENPKLWFMQIERFHRTLKASISCHEESQWTKVLPLILLGLRSSTKSSINCSPAEMVYGETLHLPGQYFSDSTSLMNTNDFVTHLQTIMSRIKSISCSNNSKPLVFLNKDLHQTSYVWIRNDHVQKPLQQKFHGPYKVIKRFDKYFTLKIGNKTDNISIDRLKPAFIEIHATDAEEVVDTFSRRESKSVSFSLGGE